jgi:hypothetical protein
MTGDKSPEGKGGLDGATGQRMSSVWGVDDDPELLIGGRIVRSGKATAVGPFSASRDEITSRAPGPSGIARAALYVGAKTSKPLLDDVLDVLQTGGDVVARSLAWMSAYVEDLHEAKKKDPIVTIDKTKRRGQTAMIVRLPNWLWELDMPRLTCIQVQTRTPKREDQPFVKGWVWDAAHLVRESQSLHWSLA